MSDKLDVSQLEPAERNTKREVTTLLVILAIAFGAGILILFNYMQMREDQEKQLQEGRAPEIYELNKNYSFKNKDDENSSFFDCTGKVTLLACFSAKQLDDSKVVMDALRQLSERFKDEPRVQVLLLSMDDEKDMPASEVMPILKEAGLTGDNWNVALSNGSKFLAYIKKELKFIHLSDGRENEKWRVPERIRILGPALKVRGKESEYDFMTYQRDTEEARRDLANDPKFLNDPEYKGDVSKIDLVQHAITTIGNNIDYMLKNEEFDKEKIDEAKTKNIYTPYLWLFGGFVLFLGILWLKVKRAKLLEQDKAAKANKEWSKNKPDKNDTKSGKSSKKKK